jgi:serine/threonine protein kinase/ribosomal protein L40E
MRGIFSKMLVAGLLLSGSLFEILSRSELLVLLCPHCGGENSENARFCRHCGSPISAEVYSSTRLPLGTILDERYKIIDYVAKGGMGAIYKALDLSQKGVFWAVKEMLDYFDTDEEREYAVERFAMEAQILYDLNHECIPKFVDCFVSENRYYLVMEFIEGCDLRKILENGIKSGVSCLKEEDVLSWAIQICDVLSYLHTHDPPIVYRDMKPGNMMVNTQNKIYLIDFGIARLFDPRVKGTMVGTQGYAPPEQYKGEAEPRSDLYSTAACMHHLLTGKDPRNDIPFNFPPARSIRSDLSDYIEEVLLKALAMEIKHRYNSMLEMRNVLMAVRNKIMGIEDDFSAYGMTDSGYLTLTVPWATFLLFQGGTFIPVQHLSTRKNRVCPMFRRIFLSGICSGLTEDTAGKVLLAEISRGNFYGVLMQILRSDHLLYWGMTEPYISEQITGNFMRFLPKVI